jgi:hypothetical protein
MTETKDLLFDSVSDKVILYIDVFTPVVERRVRSKLQGTQVVFIYNNGGQVIQAQLDEKRPEIRSFLGGFGQSHVLSLGGR